MSKRAPLFLLALFAAVLFSGCFALAEPEAASGTAVAPTLAPAEAGVDTAAAEPDLDAPATATPPVEYPAVAEPAAPQAAEPLAAYPAQEGDTAVPEPEMPASGAPTTFTIDPARSEARFIINEVLRGTPTTVVGVTSNLAGQLLVDLNDPAGAQVGPIVINARDLKTDNNFRNNAIANEILLTNEFEFITFTPTAVSGLPGTAEVGQTYPLEISGDLTITGQTQPVTFAGSVTLVSGGELTGQAAATIAYADFGLTIPFARSVESVEDTVVLELDFTAAAQ